jgi:hypothetical protein
MSFNVLALFTVAGRRTCRVPGRWRTPFLNHPKHFLIQTSETKNAGQYAVFVADSPAVLRVLTRSSYAYEINYVLNGSGSQSNVV